MENRRVNPGRICAMGSPSRRRSRTQKEWKVDRFGDDDRFSPSSKDRHARAHFTSSAALLVNVNGENRRWRDAMAADEMSDAVRNDARFAASGAGQDQQRTFGCKQRLRVVAD